MNANLGNTLAGVLAVWCACRLSNLTETVRGHLGAVRGRSRGPPNARESHGAPPRHAARQRRGVARVAPTSLPRKPHETVLYHLVKDHGNEFLQYARDAYDGPLPRYVLDELRGYLRCGDFALCAPPMHQLCGCAPAPRERSPQGPLPRLSSQAARTIMSARARPLKECRAALLPIQMVQEQSKAYSEMSDAASAMSELAEELKTSTNAQKSAEELAASAEELSANADEVKASAGQIATAIEQIQKAASIQGKAAEKAKDLGLQLMAASRAMGERANESVDKGAKVKQTLEVSKVSVDALIGNIAAAAAAAVDSARNVKELEERTRRIDKIVDAIVMVTVQTNMLAVNGNVEAARAGEYGRGFSVVAGDIRSLANESSENADRIKDLVRQVQSQIARVAGDIETAGKTAVAETEKAKVTTQALERISNDVDGSAKAIQEVSIGASEAAKALEQAGKATEQISAAATQMTNATAEAASAGEEASKAAQEIAQAVEEIASQADDLQHG
jgi:hypothetical protein